jgi:signal transduction histidine kinase
MDAQETGIYTAAIITTAVIIGIIVYFITSILRQQRRNLDLHKQYVLAEITAIERDRARIAYDLHDELGPMLSSMKLKLSILELSGEDDKNLVKSLNENFDTAIGRIRGISYNLTPNVLKRTGLAAALREYIYSINSSGLLKISLNFPDNVTFSEEASVNIYRVVQEIIHNAIKHAGASQLDIDCRAEKNNMVLKLSDDGVGFDQKEVLNHGGLGLKSLYNRTRLLHGKMYLETKPGSGTSFTFEIPNNV